MFVSPVSLGSSQRAVLFGKRPTTGAAAAPEPEPGPKKPDPKEAMEKATPFYRIRMAKGSDTFQYKTGEKTKVTSLIGGRQVFTQVDELLKKAQKSVTLHFYNMQSLALYPERVSPPWMPGSKIQGNLVERLVAMKKQGYNIKVVLDNHTEKNNELETQYNERTIEYLRQNGVDVVTYPAFSQISHIKLMVVDDRYAIIGGMNWGNHSPSNHDAAVLIEGPDARNLYHHVFRNDWISSGGDPKDIPDYKPFPEGKIKVLQTASKESASGARDEIYQEILQQIDAAQESIYAELFVLTQKQVVDKLISAHYRLQDAGKEGVKILVDPGLFFKFPNTRPQVQRLAKAGIPIRFFASKPETEEKLHSKWAVFDHSKVLMGSANWSNVGLLTNHAPAITKERISRSNHEVAVLIDSEPVAKPFIYQFLYDWKHTSFPILEFRDGKWRPIRPDKPDKGTPPQFQGLSLTG